MPVPHDVDEVGEALRPSRKRKFSRLIHLLGGFIFHKQIRSLGEFTISPIADTDLNLLVRDILESRNSDLFGQVVAVPIDVHLLAHFIQI